MEAHAPSKEAHQVDLWRIEQLRQMGFSESQVVSLQNWGVDLHDADYLISRGCAPHIALVILEPLP